MFKEGDSVILKIDVAMPIVFPNSFVYKKGYLGVVKKVDEHGAHVYFACVDEFLYCYINELRLRTEIPEYFKEYFDLY